MSYLQRLSPVTPRQPEARRPTVASASGFFPARRRGAQSGPCSGLTPFPGSPNIPHIYHII